MYIGFIWYTPLHPLVVGGGLIIALILWSILKEKDVGTFINPSRLVHSITNKN